MNQRLRASLALSAAALLLSGAAARPEPGFDLLIRGGEIYTGEAKAPFIGSIGISGDRIVYVGRDKPGLKAKRIVDARGMAVTPGLIDVHTHPDTYIRSSSATERLNAPWLMQGVTTIFIGVDGYGTPDVGADSRKLEGSGIGTNIVPYVGFGAVRRRVLGASAAKPDAEQLLRMRKLVAGGMCDGAIGFSTGLFYAPQSFADTEEVIALASEAAKRGGVYDTHQRDESSYTIGLLGSVREVIRIGREAGLPVHFAHLKALGVDVQGQAPAIIAEIEKARAAGQSVTADQYPWLASGSNLEASLIPRWAVDGGTEAMRKRFDDPALLARIKAEARDNLRRRGGAESMLLTSSGEVWTGKKLSEIAATWKMDPIDAAIRILRQSEKTSIASFNMREDDVEAIMKRPWVVTSSDGSDGHPRQFATFPELYRNYVVGRRVITFDQFVRRSTGASADMFRLQERGYLRPGYFADILVLDRARYRPRATYLEPRRLSEGVRDLVVNGRIEVEDYKLTGLAAGRALLRRPPAGTCPG